MLISGGSWFHVRIVWYEKKFTLTNEPDGMGLSRCNLCLLSWYKLKEGQMEKKSSN